MSPHARNPTRLVQNRHPKGRAVDESWEIKMQKKKIAGIMKHVLKIRVRLLNPGMTR